MKGIRMGLTLAFIAALLLWGACALAETSGTCGAQGDNLTWTLDDEGTLTIHGSGKMTNYYGRYVDGIYVTNAPWGSDIKAVVIESGVTSIGDRAFLGCSSLASITIPDGVTSIGNSAFEYCSSLVGITIPDGVTSIGDYAFCGCSSLASITIPDGVTSIGNSAFRGCSSLASITIPDGVTSIGYYAFCDCSSLASITIPDGVTSIGGGAFRDCSSLASITIPDGVTSIGDYAFEDCSSLASITIPDGVTSIGDSAFYNGPAKLLANMDSNGAKALSKAGYSFRVSGNNYDFRYLYTNDSITGLGIFDVDKDVTSFTIPDNVTSIGYSAFEDCSSLASITIPDGVTSIGDSAFYNGPAKLLANMDSNGAKALSKAGYSFRVSGNNYDFRYLYTNDSITGLGIFDVDKDVTSFTIPDGVTSIGYRAFYGCSSLASITIPDGVTNIGIYAFYGCSSLASITIPDGVTSIGIYAFDRCSSLASITIPDGVTSIGDYAFDGCSSLASITIPNGVTNIGNYTFRDCSNLASITIPDSVTSIGRDAFHGCSSLASITIPDGVTSIGRDAFHGCSSLASITIPDGVTSIGYYAFNNCSSLASITIRDGVTSIGDYAFLGCSSLASITIPDSVTSIGEGTFSGCRSLASITIPDGVISIGDSAFEYNELKKVCILSETTSFGSYAFARNPSNMTIYCWEYSDADAWATDKGYSVVYLDTLDFDSIREVRLQEDFRMAKGETRNFGVDIFPNDRPEITWSNSAPSVVSLQNGVVTALKPGTATITATVGGVSDSVDVTVYTMAESYELNTAEAWLVAKETLQLAPVKRRPAGSELELRWSSSDTNFASVDGNGLVTTKKPGEVTITATGSNGVVRTCKLHLCYPVTGIAFDPASVSLPIDGTAALTANITTRDGKTYVNKLVTFTSDDEAVATVDENGIVTVRGAGTATITATAASGVSATCSVTVREARTLTLPAGLTAIDEEAFMNDTSLESVIVPEGCRSIGARAFAGCSNLSYIRLPADCAVAADAFEGCGDVTIDRVG